MRQPAPPSMIGNLPVRAQLPPPPQSPPAVHTPPPVRFQLTHSGALALALVEIAISLLALSLLALAAAAARPPAPALVALGPGGGAGRDGRDLAFGRGGPSQPAVEAAVAASAVEVSGRAADLLRVVVAKTEDDDARDDDHGDEPRR